MQLIVTILATLVAGIGSVWIAALFMRWGVDRRMGGMGSQHLLSLAAGALLATAFMHLLPEAFESQSGARELFAALVVGLVFFFLLDKAELWHHGHEHGQGHSHGHSHDHDHANDKAGAAAHSPKATGSWAILAGDSVHCFGDGILIASAMVADIRLGLVAALAVLVHEVPHHMGDLVVLRQGGAARSKALLKVSMAGSTTMIGGLAGLFLVDVLYDWLPYFLVLASSSFIYVALADLIPQLQKRLTVPQTIAQVGWLLGGMGAVTLISGLAHGH